jgi:hypothetical protein
VVTQYGHPRDIYVASVDEAPNYDMNPKPFEKRSAQWKGYTEHELSMFWAFLQGRDWDAGVHLSKQFQNVLNIDDGMRTITRLPEAFLELVLAADDRQIERAIEQWAATGELSHYDLDLVREFIADLVRLGKFAQSSGKSVYLWNCV